MSHLRKYATLTLSWVTLSFVCLQLLLPPSFAPAWLGLALFGSSASIRLDIPIPLVTGAVFTIDSTNNPLFHPVNFYGIILLLLSTLLTVLSIYLILRIRARIEDKAIESIHIDSRNKKLGFDVNALDKKQTLYYMGIYMQGQRIREMDLEERIELISGLHRRMLWSCSQAEYNRLYQQLQYEEMVVMSICQAGLTQYEEIKSMNEDMEL